MAQTNINLLTLTGDSDKTVFKNYALKVDGQVDESHPRQLHLLREQQDQERPQRRPARVRRKPPGTRPARPSTTRAKATSSSAAGCSRRSRSRTWTAASSWRRPAGSTRTTTIDDGGVTHNTFYQYQSIRPQDYVGGDANYFAGKHEVKFGAAWRSTPVTTDQIWPASHLIAILGRLPEHVRAGGARLPVHDRSEVPERLRHRHDLARSADPHRRRAVRPPGVVARQRAGPRRRRHPDPAGAQRDGGHGRLQVEQRHAARRLHLRGRRRRRKSIVRGSYAMFASQLPGDEAKFVSPIQYSYAYYNAVDRNGDGIAQIGEILFNQGLVSSTGFDPTNPARLSTVNAVDPNIKAPLTHELLFGVDRELVPNFGVSATFTYRRMDDLTWKAPTGISARDYIQTGTLDGTLPERRHVQRAALRAQDDGRAAGGPDGEPTAPATTSATGASSSARPSACRTAGWRASGSRPTTGASTSTIRRCRSSIRRRRRSDRLPNRPFAGPLVDGGLGRQEVGRQRQEQHLPGRPEVSDRRQRLVSRTVGVQLRREPRDASGLRAAVLPEQRRDRRLARAQGRAARRAPWTPSGCRRSARSTRASRRCSSSGRRTSRSPSTCSTC